MICPDCGEFLEVKNTRKLGSGEHQLVFRFRTCRRCGARWKGTERLVKRMIPPKTKKTGQM